MSDNKKLFTLDDDFEDTDEIINPDDITIVDMSEVALGEREVVETAKKNKLLTFLLILICIGATIGVLALFSNPEHHSRTDAIFKSCLQFINEGSAWLFLVLAVGIALVILYFGFLAKLDKTLRRAPGGMSLYNKVGLCFESRPFLRMLPTFVCIIYFLAASYLSIVKSMTFDPPTYFPINQQLCLGEWLNVVCVALFVFTTMLVIAEGVVVAGPIGAIVHLLIVLPFNVYASFFIIYGAIALIQFVGQLFMIIGALILVCIAFPILLKVTK